MSHHSSSVNGEGTSHKDSLSRILDELSSLKLWKEKLERKEKGKERVKINQGEREQIKEKEIKTKLQLEVKNGKVHYVNSNNKLQKRKTLNPML